jgi:malate synthase
MTMASVRNFEAGAWAGRQPAGVRLLAPIPEGCDGILSAGALAFVAALHRTFEAKRQELLRLRVQRQAELDRGVRPDFLASTRHVREASWKVAPIPRDLRDRRVEITGPVDRKMIINALNSGARVFMADLEDSQSPTWEGVIQGQKNLFDAVRQTISFESPEGKRYTLGDKPATLFVRPRGWHLHERHVLVDGEPVSASLLDFGLCFFHNAREQLARGAGPYFYLPKLESHLEARLWNDVFEFAQRQLSLPTGTIRATVLIETILAAFEMDEVLYELREHVLGLNCGRWDYIFSVIKKFREDPRFVLPDRAQVTMTTHFLRSYSRLLIQTCHKRGAFAMGGMAAFIPIKHDAEANDRAIASVRADKEREATDGHDGTWVAHPALVPVAMQIFDRLCPTPNQLHVLREDVRVTPDDLLAPVRGTITERGLASNIAVAIRYLESWLRGVGCVPIFNLMEDAATAEISRAQVWQWIRHGSVLEDGRVVTRELVRVMIARELDHLRAAMGDGPYRASRCERAAAIFDRLVTEQVFGEFLTLPAYEALEQG